MLHFQGETYMAQDNQDQDQPDKKQALETYKGEDDYGMPEGEDLTPTEIKKIGELLGGYRTVIWVENPLPENSVSAVRVKAICDKTLRFGNFPDGVEINEVYSSEVHDGSHPEDAENWEEETNWFRYTKIDLDYKGDKFEILFMPFSHNGSVAESWYGERIEEED